MIPRIPWCWYGIFVHSWCDGRRFGFRPPPVGNDNGTKWGTL